MREEINKIEREGGCRVRKREKKYKEKREMDEVEKRYREGRE